MMTTPDPAVLAAVEEARQEAAWALHKWHHPNCETTPGWDTTYNRTDSDIAIDAYFSALAEKGLV